MQILVLTINYWPEATGIGAVLTRRCEYLASIGHEVTVCTAMPYYPEWRIHDGYTRKLFARESRHGVNILRSWLWVPKRVTSAKRVLLEASFFATSLLRALSSGKPDLLLVVSPPLGLALSAVLLSRWSGAPYVFDVEDLQPDSAGDLGMLPPAVLPALFRLEAMAYRKAALISTVTEGMRQRIIAKKVDPQKVIVVPPPADKNCFAIHQGSEGRDFRRQHRLEGKFLVAHSGNMGVKQGLNVVLEAAEKLRHHPDLAFLLAGNGAMRPQLEARARALQLRNLHFLPLLEQPQFLQMLAAIDMALIVQQATVSDIAFPSKTVTLLSAARPIAAAVSASSEIGRVLRQSEGGVVTEPERVDGLASTIQDLFGDPAKRAAMGECGRRYARQHWDEARLLPNFAYELSRVAGLSALAA
ncbi:MAG TPA: WcaI family glycosyltransferase [Terriglobales bacterium]|jgi:colanic acid biosynthesis glycosyl transferase WcaI|nr:WcaI family glycosyltransferase [Terriglobales bacterium]